MKARDHWTLDLVCPKCGNAGGAEVSEGDYPFLNNPEFSVDAIHGAFSVVAVGQTAFETTFRCGNCRTVIE